MLGARFAIEALPCGASGGEVGQQVFLYPLSPGSKPPIKAFMSPQIAGTIRKDNVRIEVHSWEQKATQD